MSDNPALQHLSIKASKEHFVISFLQSTLLEFDQVNEVGEELMLVQEQHADLNVLVSFEGVQVIGSAALGKLITLQRRVDRSGKRLVFFQMIPEVYEMFTSSRLNDYFQIHADFKSALASLNVD